MTTLIPFLLDRHIVCDNVRGRADSKLPIGCRRRSAWDGKTICRATIVSNVAFSPSPIETCMGLAMFRKTLAERIVFMCEFRPVRPTSLMSLTSTAILSLLLSFFSSFSFLMLSNTTSFSFPLTVVSYVTSLVLHRAYSTVQSLFDSLIARSMLDFKG